MWFAAAVNPDRRARWRTPARRRRAPAARHHPQVATARRTRRRARNARPTPARAPDTTPGTTCDLAPARRTPTPGLSQVQMLRIERDISARTTRARRTAPGWPRGHLCLNLVSSPGSGKTSLLVRTLQLLAGACPRR